MIRRLHIAGSADPELLDTDALGWAHGVVRTVVRSHIAAGGTVLTQVGDDPTHNDNDRLRVLFDWTVMEACRDAVEAGGLPSRQDNQPLVFGICTSSGRERVSETNEETLSGLREANALDLTILPDRFRFGALLRQVQAAKSDALITIGGSVGVEHLVRLHMEMRHPIVPLDLEIGASDGDEGHGGSALAREARSRPDDFLEVSPPATASAHLDGLRTSSPGGRPAAETAAARISALLEDLRPPRAFYVRLLDQANEAFADVEWFYRSVVDPVVGERGLQRMEVGTDAQRQGFMNAEIFTELHYASTVIVDMTARRPNCAIELGYALARGQTVLLACRGDEEIPFDVDKLPCLFWQREEFPQELQQRLREYWNHQAHRGPVVPRSSLS